MLNKLLIAGAVGASVFAVVGASASALNDSSPNGQVVQTSDALSATCNSSGQFQTVVGTDGKVDAIRMYQQDFQHQCYGDEAQAVLTLTGGGKTYSDIDTFNGDGLDVYLAFPSGVDPSQVQSVQVTIAGQIQAEQGVTHVNQYGGKPDEVAPQ